MSQLFERMIESNAKRSDNKGRVLKMEEKMSDVYEKRIIDDIEEIQAGAYSDIEHIDKFPPQK